MQVGHFAAMHLRGETESAMSQQVVTAPSEGVEVSCFLREVQLGRNTVTSNIRRHIPTHYSLLESNSVARQR